MDRQIEGHVESSVLMPSMPRPEYPRPQFVRAEWLNLNGTWGFDFDDRNAGLFDRWAFGRDFSRTITVPFCFESPQSGIGDTDFHNLAWYRRTFEIPEHWKGQRIFLNFGAVDYRAWVWVNGVFVTHHVGGHTPFQAEITHALREGENQIILRAEDMPLDLQQPRGKQFWEEKSRSIYYTRTSGIWQTVWLEPVGSVFLESARITPDIDAGAITVHYLVNRDSPRDQSDKDLEIEVSFAGQVIATSVDPVRLTQRQAYRRIELPGFDAEHLWSPEHPVLYDIVFRIKEGDRILDEVKSYFGMRKIAVQDDKVMLNNQPYYMKLVLDQGYFPDGIMTAPSDLDLRCDIELTKEMGFNGARKHQKIEDPRYLYWADHLGLLVWEEMPSRHTYTSRSISQIMSEWQEAIDRDYNHPCIVVWVPMNESWGTPRLKTEPTQRSHLLSLYHLTKSLDATRLVISNDGWEHAQSDLCTIHDYTYDEETLKARYASTAEALKFTPEDRGIYAPSFDYGGEPLVVSECGGIAYQRSDWEGWGYSCAISEVEFVELYSRIVSILLRSPIVQGFCYTQLTDVEQEINGLLTYDRRPKVPLETIRRINEGRPA